MKTPSLLALLIALLVPFGAAAQDPAFPSHLTRTYRQGDQVDGDQAPDSGGRALRVSGRVTAAGGDGVLASQGGQVNGWAVSIEQSRLVASLRHEGALLRVVAGADLPEPPFTFRFDLLDGGGVALQVNGARVAEGKAPGFLPGKPGDPLIVGADSAAPVGDYRTPFRFGGTIESVTVALGVATPADDRAYGTLRTRWAARVDPKLPHPEYPRPQMTRPDWTNLNGPWDHAITPKEAARPATWDGPILVPFPVQSQLSGVQRHVSPEQALWYRRSLPPLELPSGSRILLHFGAVDWECEVFLDGRSVGRHRGGYDPFTLDLTGAWQGRAGAELAVRVWDPTDTGSQPRGKQVTDPRGIWYTPVTGIWQTVWLETVPAASIASLKPVPDLDDRSLGLTVSLRGDSAGHTVRAVARDAGREVARAEGPASGTTRPLRLSLPEPRAWRPDDPHLYDLRVELLDAAGRTVDAVDSYFGMREIALGPDRNGVPRLLLNGEPLFHYGPLDQGWWPDGLYTAPTDEALVSDLEVTKQLGFNTVRKHVKVEPARWYWHCDRLGLLVWQDLPTGFVRGEPGAHVAAGAPEDWKRPADSAAQWDAELAAMLRFTQPFPSVVLYVPHNEGWGQHDTNAVADRVKALDPTRLVNAVSGWQDRGGGDLLDVHLYPGPGMEPVADHPGRAVVLGEFGGLGLPLEDHLWWREKRNWGYRTYQDRGELFANYQRLLHSLRPMIHRGLSAAIYTQTTDVEGEVNGLLTYDRETVKFDPAALRRLHRDLYATDPHTAAAVLVPDSESAGQGWRYTTEAPADDWRTPGFDDRGWSEGAAPFQDGSLAWEMPRGTEWKTPRLWLRRAFDLEDPPDAISLRLHAASPVKIYLNGRNIHQNPKQLQHSYQDIAIPDAAGALRPGRNVLAIEATAEGDRNGIDAGLYGYPHLTAVEPAPPPARPNVLFILIDDLGYGDLSVTGNADVPTPNIDRLAREGLTLTQFHVASPICSPSRAGCLTGSHPARWRLHSFLNDRKSNASRGMAQFLDPAAPSVARVFQQAGYATGHFGKWHLGGGRDIGEAPLPQAYGFDESLTSFEGLGDRVLPGAKGLSAQSAALGRGQVRVVAKHELTPIYVDRAIDFIDRRRHEGAPFYLHLWLDDVHDGHQPGAAQLAKWRDRSPNPNVQKFYAVLDAMDRDLGRLLDHLDEAGLAKDTLVLLTSDNGPTAWPHYYEAGHHPPAGSTGGDRGRKWSLYQGGIRMPAFVRWPGRIPAGAVNAGVASALDLFPTFCGLAGVAPPPGADLEGQDLSAAWLRNETVVRNRPLFWEYGRDDTYLRPGLPRDRSPNLAMRDGDWKCLVNADGSGLELYDLASDPRESADRAGAEPERAARMKAALLEWRSGLP